jgi:hypothetical protein
MSILQLNPPIPMVTPKGSGYAILVVDYSQEHHLCWVVALDEGGGIWMFENPEVRAAHNATLGRVRDLSFSRAPGPIDTRLIPSKTPYIQPTEVSS